jgi:beta-lactamase regulating signal transducer with metallopeptidase domain
MNDAPSLIEWGATFGIVAIGVTTVVALAEVATRLVRLSAWARMMWRLAFVALLAFVVAEMTGVAGGVSRWTLSNYGPQWRTGLAEFEPGSGEATEFNPTPIDAAAASESLTEFEEWLLLTTPLGIQHVAGTDASPRSVAWLEAGLVTWWPGIVWLSGTFALVVRLIVGRVLTHAARARSVPQADGELANRLEDLAGRLGRIRVRCVIMEGIASPIAYGVFRPTIGLPPAFLRDFDGTQQTVMLAHELEHLVARDPLWLFVTEFVTALLWWHPLAWWARHRLRAVSEWAADEASLLVQDGPEVLAACLVEIGGRLLRTHRAAWLGIRGSGFRSSLGQRVTRLLSMEGRQWARPGNAASIGIQIFAPAALVAAALSSTGWSYMQTSTKGETMEMTLQKSWRNSLVAAALSTFGTGLAPAMAAPLDSPSDPSAVAQKDGDDSARRAQEIKEKLMHIDRVMSELKSAGRDEELEQVAKEAREMKLVLEKLARAQGFEKIARVKEKEPFKTKISSDDTDELRARLKKLEHENAELREALADYKRKLADPKQGNREDLERVHKELMEMVKKEHVDLEKKQDLEKALLFDKMKRLHMDEQQQKKFEEDGKAKELHGLHEKMELVARARAKLLNDGQAEEAEKLEADLKKMGVVAEKIAKARMDGEPKKVPAPNQEMTAMFRELREEVSKLRNEVAELRKAVKDGGDKR